MNRAPPSSIGGWDPGSASRFRGWVFCRIGKHYATYRHRSGRSDDDPRRSRPGRHIPHVEHQTRGAHNKEWVREVLRSRGTIGGFSCPNAPSFVRRDQRRMPRNMSAEPPWLSCLVGIDDTALGAGQERSHDSERSLMWFRMRR
jgi:hypothetical protein